MLSLKKSGIKSKKLYIRSGLGCRAILFFLFLLLSISFPLLAGETEEGNLSQEVIVARTDWTEIRSYIAESQTALEKWDQTLDLTSQKLMESDQRLQKLETALKESDQKLKTCQTNLNILQQSWTNMSEDLNNQISSLEKANSGLKIGMGIGIGAGAIGIILAILLPLCVMH